MDSRQHHLPIACLCQTSGFPDNLLRLAAPHTASGIRDDAIAADLIAAILDLYKCSGMFCILSEEAISLATTVPWRDVYLWGPKKGGVVSLAFG